MSDTVMTFDDIEDYRYNPFTNTHTPKLIGYQGNTAERRTVPNTSPYWIKLFESPQENIPSTTRITLVIGGTELIEVGKTTTPGNLQYRVNYDEKGNGIVEFNSAQKGEQVDIQYYGLGQLIQKATYEVAYMRAIEDLYGNSFIGLKIFEDNWDMDTQEDFGIDINIPGGFESEAERKRIRYVEFTVSLNDESKYYHSARTLGSLYVKETNTYGNTIELHRENASFFDDATFNNAKVWVLVWYDKGL